MSVLLDEEIYSSPFFFNIGFQSATNVEDPLGAFALATYVALVLRTLLSLKKKECAQNLSPETGK